MDLNERKYVKMAADLGLEVLPFKRCFKKGVIPGMKTGSSP
jgi:hypothetical protein